MPLDTAIHAIPRLKGDERLGALGKPQRIWAIGSLYGRYGALCQMHDILTKRIKAKDRIIYLGNYLGEHSGWTGEAQALIDELIAFRNGVMAIPGLFANDIIFLRGRGEDLLHEALRLPFQKNPPQWLMEAERFGLEWYNTLYGGFELDAVANSGLIGMNKWVQHVKSAMTRQPGHADFFKTLKSAAYTQYRRKEQDIAFVPTGLHAHYALNLQHDFLCWPEEDIHTLTAYHPFARVVRGQALYPTAPELNRFVITLDDGKNIGGGLDGSLYAACLDHNGHILEWFEF